MITKLNFKDLLLKLGFNERSNVLTKKFTAFNCTMKVDFDKELLIYPKELKINRSTTTNFSQNENFVIFECIYRLLNKDYNPNHIELEKPMPGGHHETGGYCDIIIKNNDDRPILLIECKTANREFEEAWKKMLNYGGQLFNYYNTYRQAEYLCLYSSDFIKDEVVIKYNLISMSDNNEYLKSVPLLSSYKKVKDENGGKDAYFNVWKETYQQDYSTRGLFEDDIMAYNIGKQKYTVDDLVEVESNLINKKYNEFATILRQHNVSGRENAFDKLVNLFLVKIVDETQNSRNLGFYWKGAAFDNYFNFQDRLQKMYKIGMEKFLGEEVTYIDQEVIDESFHLFKNDPDATKEKILEYFRQLKFFTNNDFSFLDVHNEQLFFQNSVVLKKAVQMLQDIKLVTKSHHQFLGDLFEYFLDHGVKQSEGQYFTPLPIVRFIISSLPLENIIKYNTEIPNVIDYACGAGHFLSEYASQIKPYVLTHTEEEIKTYYSAITGIEKEYRLSKVAKVSCFMYGQDEVKIIYNDALADNKQIKNGSFSVLVANPPYSVKGFLETLSEVERRKYALMNHVTDISKTNSIETFFIERAKQLLKSGGIAAIILPTSILSNGNNIFIKCREIILESFDIVGISEFGSGTFGKTGTNTVTLFMRRKNDNPSLAAHFRYRVDSWFNNDTSKDELFKDYDLLVDYCSHLGYKVENYVSLFSENPDAVILGHKIFRTYKRAFDKSTECKNFKKKKIFLSLNDEDKETSIFKYFVSYIKRIEKDKLYYFLLAASNPQPILISKSPSSNKAIKKFLGYEWSGAKGSEGCRIIGSENSIKNIKTPLFNPINHDDENKINTLIRRNFTKEITQIPSVLDQYVSLSRLTDMIDFSRSDCDKSIRINAVKKNELITAYKLIPLGDLCEIVIGGTPSRENDDYFQGNNLWLSISEMNSNVITDTKEKITDEAVQVSNVKKIPKGTTLLSFKLSIGKLAIAGKDLYTNEAIAGLIPKNKSELLDEYLFHLFDSKLIDLVNVGNKAFGKSLNKPFLEQEVEIPQPPIKIQKKIIKSCREIDTKLLYVKNQIQKAKEEVQSLFEELSLKSDKNISLSDDTVFEILLGKRVLEIDLVKDGKIPIFSANVFEPFGYFNEELLADYSSPSIIWGIDGDWMVNFIQENFKFYPTDHCGVLRVHTEEILPRYLAWALHKLGETVNFNRVNRASVDRIKGLIINYPSKEEQEIVMDEVKKIEQDIARNTALLRNASYEKQIILKEFLNCSS